MGIGKWILGGLGWSMYGPLGGVLGFLLGHGIESGIEMIVSGIGSTGGRQETSKTRLNDAGGSRRYTNTGNKDDLSGALLVLMAAVMKADNIVKKSELDIVKRFLVSNYGEERAKQLLLKLRDLQGKEIPLGDVCWQIKQNTDYTTRYHMLDFLFSIAGADGDVTLPETTVLRTVSNGFGINPRDYISIMARHVNDGFRSGQTGGWSRGADRGGDSRRGGEHDGTSGGRDPYGVLGLDSTATDTEIKKAYRRLAMKYHPDKVEGLGEEVKKNAEAQFREINEAYETLKSSRGMK